METPEPQSTSLEVLDIQAFLVNVLKQEINKEIKKEIKQNPKRFLKNNPHIQKLITKMKNTILFTLLILTLFSCGDTQKSMEIGLISEDYPTLTRNSTLESTELIFDGKIITLTSTEILGVSKELSNESTDAMTVLQLNQALLGAKKASQLLDVHFTMGNEPVENGLFVFGIESTSDKSLIIQMFDEEGFGMVANNQIEIYEGNNYRALNVKSLDNGSYIFRLKDSLGREITKSVVVNN